MRRLAGQRPTPGRALRATTGATVAALCFTPACWATTRDVTVVVIPGPLALASVLGSDFQVRPGPLSTATLSMTIVDGSGTAEGWQVTIAAAPGGPAASPTVRSLAVSCPRRVTCTPPANAVSYPTTASPAQSRRPVVLLSAAPGSGRGMFHVDVVIGLPPPTGSQPGGDDLTLAIASGP
jgi:hypothetical protein